MQTVLGIFSRRSDVKETIEKLETEGYSTEDISVLVHDEKNAKYLEKETGVDIGEEVLSGAATGAIAGGMAGFLAGAVFPGMGGFLVAGPIGTMLGLTGAASSTISGAVSGAAAGGVVGVLMGIGLTLEEAKLYETQIQNGAILIAVPVQDGDEKCVVNILDKHATDVRTM